MSTSRVVSTTGRTTTAGLAPVLAASLVFAGPAAAGAQAGPTDGTLAPVEYRISFENRAHREAEVEITYRDLGPGPLELRMSRTSPGRYALHEFAKNVYDVRIEGRDGSSVDVHRPDPHQWTVSEHGGEVHVRYTLYADRADGTYSQVDRTHAHLNAPATFMFARQTFQRPVVLDVELPDGAGWEVATQLHPTDVPTRFTAADHAYFMDSPLEIADLAWREWTVPGPEGPQTVRVAMHHLGTDAELDRYAADAEAITHELAAVFGAWPRFDGGTYTFLACYTPWSSGDGMEHRNSTVLSSSGSLASSSTGLLGTLAHEFVHTWSIERIRPASLEPFDFEAANMSRELWFGEGFTSYLDDVALVRAGVIDGEAFLGRMAGLASNVVEARGRRFFSPIEMSMQAPFVDAATSVDPQNRTNTFYSYYSWGAAIGLGLDLTLRANHGTSLEALMAEMWRRHGDPERPYEVEDIEAALAAITDPAFATDFFDRYVRGRDVPDYEALFREVGVTLVPASSDARLTGAGLTPEPGGLLVSSNTLIDDPLYRAGVDRGDRIVEIDGAAATPERLSSLIGRGGGTSAELVIAGRGGPRTATVTLDRAPGFVASPSTNADGEAARRLTDWLRSLR
jgi:predicted metalloprotease with PDZ domain